MSEIRKIEEGAFNRREHSRMRLSPMYTSVLVEAKPLGRRNALGASAVLHGHAYDLSESGVRIELDQPLNIGETVALQLELPGSGCDIRASAAVIWVNDAHDDPGPRRMALRFTEFTSTADQRRLCTFLNSTVQRAAA